MRPDQTGNVGQRVARLVFSALACAVALVITVDLIRSIWPWLLAGIVLALASWLLLVYLRRPRAPW